MEKYEEKIIELAHEIIKHGYGKVTIRAEQVREIKTKITIEAGKSYVYFKKNIVDLDNTQMI